MKVNKVVSALMLVGLMLESFNSFAQSKTLKTASDGFQWYQLYQNGKYGAQSSGGTTFIPLSRGYTFICYHPRDNEGYYRTNGYFSVEKNRDGSGACDITGREIVAPGRYDFVTIFNIGGYEYCYVLLNDRYGICDMNGQEIIPPKYASIKCDEKTKVFKYKDASGNWVSTGIKLSSLAQTPTEAPTPTPSPTPTPTPTPTPEPIRQPQPFQVWKTCFMCGGSGQCPYCYGYGWAANGKDACGICHGTGKCSQCAGHGGHNEIEYH